MSQPQRKLTVEDYEHFPEGDGKRHELIDGEHVVTAAPFVPHQRAARRAVRGGPGCRAHGHQLGEVLFAPVDVELRATTCCSPTCSL